MSTYWPQRLKEDAKEVYRMMTEGGGHVYICGGTAMGREVVKLLMDLHVSEGGKTEEAAAKAKAESSRCS